jgi:phosphorylcholine metabolism protein LicD
MKKIIKKYFSSKKVKFLSDLKINFIEFFSSLHLRFLRPSLFFIPVNHLKMINILIDVIKIVEKLNINYFIISGTLLGAIRQNSFAGRPGDIDLAINKKDLIVLKKFLNTHKKKLNITQGPTFKDSSLWLRIKGETVDINLFNKTKKKFIGKCYCYFKKKHINLILPSDVFINKKKSNLYNIHFYVPKNYIYVIKKLYGNKWKIPNKHQFVWRKMY